MLDSSDECSEKNSEDKGMALPGWKSSLLGRRALATTIGGMLAAPRVHAAQPTTFGLTPVFLDSDIILVRQIEAYLTRQLDRPVTVVKRRTYREVTSLLLAGQLDAARICGYPFVTHRDDLSLVAVPSYRGAPL